VGPKANPIKTCASAGKKSEGNRNRKKMVPREGKKTRNGGYRCCMKRAQKGRNRKKNT